MENVEKKLDTSRLNMVASLWKDKDRYNAARVCYSSMRVIDDLIDYKKAKGKKFSRKDKEFILVRLDGLVSSVEKGIPETPSQSKLIKIINEFKIPSWPWKKFSEAMVYDLNNNGFETFQDFLDYSEGAAVAPASIFVHLAGLERKNGIYTPPSFNIEEVARPAAIFSYLVHIIRDFQKDQRENQNYFSKDLLRSAGLTPEELKEFSNGREPTSNLRFLMKKYYDFAEHYREETLNAIKKAKSQ